MIARVYYFRYSLILLIVERLSKYVGQSVDVEKKDFQVKGLSLLRVKTFCEIEFEWNASMYISCKFCDRKFLINTMIGYELVG